MTAAPWYAIVLALLNVIPGQNAGWGTGEVEFIGRLGSDEHKEIYPICAGQYTVEAVIIQVDNDPLDVLHHMTRVNVCYDGKLNLASSDVVRVRGTYHDGASPLVYYGRVEAQVIYKLDGWSPPQDDEDDDEDDEVIITSPYVLTGAIEATETSVTMQGILMEDGGEPCRCRFLYRSEDGRSWTTEWQEQINQGQTFSQRVDGLIPGTYYICWIEAENSGGWNTGREAGFRTLPEKVPPIPHPAAWIVEPDQIDTVSITMTAEAVRDLSGPQEYAFDFVASPTGGSGGSDSVWQFSPIFVDVGLNPNQQYGYRVSARDANGNETAYSPVRYAYTSVETPKDVTFGQITAGSIQAQAGGVLSNLTAGLSGVRVENVTAGRVSEWQRNNALWTCDGLLPNTRYTFRAQARNGDGDPTPFCAEAHAYTLALVPTAPAFGQPAGDKLAVYWSSNGNPYGTQYWCENTVTHAHSGWTTGASWTDSGLSPNTSYTYRVKARNADGLETDFSAQAAGYSAIEAPSGIVFGTVTTASIQVRSLNTPANLAQGGSGLLFENVTTGQMSSWQRGNDAWTSDGLQPNRSYSFRARARNGDGVQTQYSPVASIHTQANAPGTPSFIGVSTTAIQVQWPANGNPAGTEYLCENTTAGTNSGWTATPAWNNTGLSPNGKYTYRVKARNADGVETAYSASAGCYSAIETPTGIAFATIAAGSIQVRSLNTPSGLAQGDSGLLFENVTTGQISSWQHDNNAWTSDALQPNHAYSFRARARNGDSVQTPACEPVSVHTQANAPAAASFAGVLQTGIQARWTANGNPAGTLYLCENTTAGTNSGWVADTTWDSTGLKPNTSYAFRVKARNADGLETAWTSLGSQSTDYRSLTVSASAGGQVTSPAQGVTRYDPGAIVAVKAAASSGYHFLEWTGTAVDAGRVDDPAAAETTVQVDAHYTLIANFLRTAIYVDRRATGAQDGSSWRNAFASLQDALDSAQRGNQIYVAKGAYKPDAGKTVAPGDRFAAFAIPSGVAVKGGYAGVAAADPNARNIALNETILSGDLNGDDKAISEAHDLYSDARRTDNSYCVVSVRNASNTTRLEGLTITAGNGIDGAGLCLTRSDVVVAQCVISINRVGELSGDGLQGWGQGAGVSCYLSNPTFSECVFYANWAGGQGGALCSFESSPTLRDCVFQGNEAGMAGGAIYGQDSNCVSVDCSFHANWSRNGGALFHDEGSSARLTNCRFLGNAGFGSGGAVFDAGRGLEAANCVFSGNLAFLDGGAAMLTAGPSVFANCTFYRNVAQAKQTGQTLSVKQAVTALANCIVWNSYIDTTREQIAVAGVQTRPAELIVSSCDVLGGQETVLRKSNATVTWGARNLAVNPKFARPDGADGVAGTEDDDLHLQSGSPCVDAGDNAAVPEDLDDLNANGNRIERLPFDLDGKFRFVDDPAVPNTGAAVPAYPSIVDLGAYERQ
ncbi:MAG: hypothetical protein GX448_04600 [Planctomycetes bacterium]|nr:hypothetical protein [Planctomycetota bacterium]